MIAMKLSWLGMNRLNWIVSKGVELTRTESIDMNWDDSIKSSSTGLKSWSELSGTELILNRMLDSPEMKRTELDWTELNWTELTSIVSIWVRMRSADSNRVNLSSLNRTESLSFNFSFQKWYELHSALLSSYDMRCLNSAEMYWADVFWAKEIWIDLIWTSYECWIKCGWTALKWFELKRGALNWVDSVFII